MRILRWVVTVGFLVMIGVSGWLALRPSDGLVERWEREAGRPVEEFVRLMAQRRARPACDRLSPRLQRDLRDIAGVDGDPHRGCVLTVSMMADAHSDEDLAALREARVTEVRVDGDRALLALDDVVAPRGVQAFDGGVAHLVVGPEGWLVDRIT